jgi:Uma2 family endonuclease
MPRRHYGYGRTAVLLCRNGSRAPRRRLYQEVGVPLYWIVDPDEKLVEVWTPESMFPVVERECVKWGTGCAEEEFVFELEGLFRPI